MRTRRFLGLHFRDNPNLYLFVGTLIAVGGVFGLYLVRALTYEQQQDLAGFLGGYLSRLGDASARDAAESFRASLLFYGQWLAAIWLLGLSVIGLPLVFAIVFLKGALSGFAAGVLIGEFSWRGILLALAALVPKNALALPALTVACVSASRFARFAVSRRPLGKKGSLGPPMAAHTAACALMMGVLCLAALMEAYVSSWLMNRIAPRARIPDLVLSAGASGAFDFLFSPPL